MKYRATQDLKSNVELRFLSQSGRGVPGPALTIFFRSLEENIEMLKATAGKILPTTITGSLPRPSWYTENLGTRSFLEAMVYTRFREQYTDTIAVYMKEQAIAGLDIVTDGDCRFNQDIGGQSWTSYPPNHMSGFDTAIRCWRARAREASDSRAVIFFTTTSKRESCRRLLDLWVGEP